MPTVAHPLHPGSSLVASTGTTVLVLVVLLVALGAAMIALAVWLVRSTRSDPPALGPLEAMGDRRFRRADGDARSARLGAARQVGAPAPAPIVPFDDAEPAGPPQPAAAAAPAPDDAEIDEPGEAEPAPTAHGPHATTADESVEEAH